MSTETYQVLVKNDRAFVVPKGLRDGDPAYCACEFADVEHALYFIKLMETINLDWSLKL